MKSFYNFNWKKEGVHVDYNLQGYYNLRHVTGGGRRSMIKVILNSKNILYNYQDFSWSILILLISKLCVVVTFSDESSHEKGLTKFCH